MLDLDRNLRNKARAQVRTAAIVALFLGTLSLVVGIMRWEGIEYADLESLIGFVDSLVVLMAGAALLRGSRVAAPILLALIIAGTIYFIWRGVPWYALIPQYAAGFFYARAIGARRYLDLTASGGKGQG